MEYQIHPSQNKKVQISYRLLRRKGVLYLHQNQEDDLSIRRCLQRKGKILKKKKTKQEKGEFMRRNLEEIAGERREKIVEVT